MITKNRKFVETSASSIFISIFLIILVLIIIGFLIISNFRINQKRIQFRSQIEILKKEIQVLEEKNQKLKAGILESEKESYLEKKARENLGLKKPGEEVVVILPAKENEKENEQEKVSKSKNIWQNILNPIKNFFVK